MQVLITGANRGIGAEFARKYLRLGHHVIGTARKTEGLNPDIEWVALDFTTPVSGQVLRTALGDRPLSGLICNAGVYPDKGLNSVKDYTSAHFTQAFQVNVVGVWETIQAALPNLRQTKGKIAIISSNMASSARAPGGSYAYRASKAAVTNLACNLATNLKPQGIAVGSYHPGWVRTEMGGSSADISVEDSVIGLMQRIGKLSLKTTGVFEGHDGEPMQF